MIRVSALRAAAIAALAGSCTALGGIVQFDQIDWRDNFGGYTAQNSEWGRATITLEAADLASFSPGPGGNGLVGYLSIVTSTGGSGTNWAVQNLPFYIDRPSDVVLRGPTGVHFDLGTLRGQDVSNLQFNASFSPTPLGSMPVGGFTPTSVGVYDRLVGGAAGVTPGGAPFSGNTGQAPPPPAQNFFGSPAGSSVGAAGRIWRGGPPVPTVAEDVNGCAPGGAARSIGYLADNFGLGITQTDQQIYEELRGYMQAFGATYGPNGSGTYIEQLQIAKDLYAFNHGLLGVLETRVSSSFEDAIEFMNKGQDIEMWVYWGDEPDPMNPGRRRSLGGHAVFATSVVCDVDAMGAVVGYTVEYVDDNQWLPGAQNDPHALHFDPLGNMMGPGANAGLMFFVIETIPAPSTFGMAVLAGIAALGRRRRTQA